MTTVQITDELLDELERKARAADEKEVEAYWDVRPLMACRMTVESAKHIAASRPATILALVEHIRSLTERLERAEKDAGRLNWIVSREATVHRFARKGRPSFGVHMVTIGKFHQSEHASPREAIDAAIAQEKDHE